MLNGIEIRALRWPWQNADIPVLQEDIPDIPVFSCGTLREGYHMREEDVFPVMHSVEIACNDNKLSPIML